MNVNEIEDFLFTGETEYKASKKDKMYIALLSLLIVVSVIGQISINGL